VRRTPTNGHARRRGPNRQHDKGEACQRLSRKLSGNRDGAGNWSSRSGHLNEVNEARACLGCEADQIVHEKLDDVARA
jgi:hypothetical protein